MVHPNARILKRNSPCGSRLKKMGVKDARKLEKSLLDKKARDMKAETVRAKREEEREKIRSERENKKTYNNKTRRSLDSSQPSDLPPQIVTRKLVHKGRWVGSTAVLEQKKTRSSQRPRFLVVKRYPDGRMVRVGSSISRRDMDRNAQDIQKRLALAESQLSKEDKAKYHY